MKNPRRDFFFLTTLLFLILVLAAGLRFYNLAGQSLWADEGNSVALAARSLSQITQDAARDIHPPLYYWLLHFWTSLFGTGEMAVRSLSATIGVILVFGLAELGRRLYNADTGLAVALIAALSPFQVYYSQEVRMYILLAALAVFSMYFLTLYIQREERRLRALQAAGGKGSWPWFPLAGLPLVAVWIAGMYTHYAFPLMIALASGLYGIWLLTTARWGYVGRRVVAWAGLLALVLICYAPWMQVAWHQLTTWPSGGSTLSVAEGLSTSFGLLGIGIAGRELPSIWPVWALLGVAILGALPWRALLSPFMPRPDAGAAGSATVAVPAGPAPLIIGEPPRLASSLALADGTRSFAGGTKGNGSASAPALLASWAGTASRPAANVPAGRGIAAAQQHTVPAMPSPTWYWVRWLLILSWALAPIVMMLALGLFRDAYLKFLLIASPAYVLLLARGVVGPANAITLWGRSRQKRATFLPGYTVAAILWVIVSLALVTLISVSALNRYFQDSRLARDDYRDIVQFINATGQADDAILLDAPGQADVFNYYYHGSLPVFPLPRQRPMDPAATQAELGQLAGYNKVYVLYWASQEADPHGTIESWMNNRSYKMLDQWRGNVRMAVYMMPEQSAPDQTAEGVNLRLGQNLTLLGYRAWNLTPHAGEVTQLQLAWLADQKPDRRYKVFLQLLDPRDQVIAQRDAEPAGESRPTDGWAAGEVILDNHGLLIPPGTPPGTYRRIVGMYDASTLQRLHLPTGEDHIDLPPITVARSPMPPPLAALDMQFNQSFDFGGVKLLGYDRYRRDFKHAPETPLRPGDRLHVTFYWQANVQPRADWWFDMTLSDASGHPVAELQAPLVGPTYSTTLWDAHEIVRGEHDLILPDGLPPDTYRLSLTLLPDTNTPAGSTYLGTVKVEKPK